MYFQNFPKIFYDVDKSDGDFSLLTLVDITKNVRVIKRVLENITLYDEYDMMDGETIELVAEKVYGNPELHWILMLVNQKYDYIRDFPLSSAELDEYIETSYGIEKFSVRHYEKDGIISEARAILKVPSNFITQFRATDFITGPSGAARVEEIFESESALSLLMDRGVFKMGELCLNSGFRLDEDTTTEPSTFSWNNRPRFNFTVPQTANAFTVNEQYIPITNYDYEVRENEKKRRIKLIAPELIQQFIREFETLIVK